VRIRLGDTVRGGLDRGAQVWYPGRANPGRTGWSQNRRRDMELRARFERGSSTYRCDSCGKLTRDTGRGEFDGVCAKCYEEGGWENEHSNDGPDHNGAGPSPDECPTCRATEVGA
jgi:rubrerythrin